MYVTRLIVDFGLVVLIWLVQLIIYPSFAFYTRDQLMVWHGKYTGLITIVVMPLMLTQAGIIIWQCLQNFGYWDASSLLLLIAAWSITFLKAVPLHNQITIDNQDIQQILAQLVRVNWWRVVVWNLLFIIALFQYLVYLYGQ